MSFTEAQKQVIRRAYDGDQKNPAPLMRILGLDKADACMDLLEKKVHIVEANDFIGAVGELCYGWESRKVLNGVNGYMNDERRKNLILDCQAKAINTINELLTKYI